MDEEQPEDFPGIDGLVGNFMQEASLWPVLVVIVGSAGALGAAILVLVGVDHNPFAAAALLLILGMTADILIRAWRRGENRHIARLIGLVWLAAIAFAALAVWTGIAF